MIRLYSSPQADAYVKSLQAARAKGRAAAEDPQFNEYHNPYRRFEQTKSWRDGFVERRREIAQAQKADDAAFCSAAPARRDRSDGD